MPGNMSKQILNFNKKSFNYKNDYKNWFGGTQCSEETESTESKNRMGFD